MEDGGWWWRVEGGGWRVEGGGWRVEGGESVRELEVIPLVAFLAVEGPDLLILYLLISQRNNLKLFS